MLKALFYSVLDKQCLKTSLAQVVTFKMSQLGPDNNTTAQKKQKTHIYIYIYIYMCVVESKLGPKMPFSGGQRLVQVLLSFSICVFFFKNLLLSAERMTSFQKKEEKTNITICWVKTWSNYVVHHSWTKFWPNLGPSFDSTFLTFLAFFPFFKICRNHYFFRVFSIPLHF